MAEKTTVVAHYIATAIGAIAGLTINEWVALCSLMLGAATFAINWYYKHKTFELTLSKNEEN